MRDIADDKKEAGAVNPIKHWPYPQHVMRAHAWQRAVGRSVFAGYIPHPDAPYAVEPDTWLLRQYHWLGVSLAQHRRELGLSVRDMTARLGWVDYIGLENGLASLAEYDAWFWQAWNVLDCYQAQQRLQK